MSGMNLIIIIIFLTDSIIIAVRVDNLVTSNESVRFLVKVEMFSDPACVNIKTTHLPLTVRLGQRP
jgi:hypothetical protein